MADEKKDFAINNIRNKLKNVQTRYEADGGDGFDFKSGRSGSEGDNSGWSAVSNNADAAFTNFVDNFLSSHNIDFVGKNLEAGKFSNENFENANFSVSNLTGVDFSGANLKGVDFSGANLSDANLSGADLTGAVLSGAVLARTNFTGAILKGVRLTEADLEDTILLDISIDEIGIEELQALVEYMAIYYPHKLNLAKINLTMLNLQKIDLRQVSLRGVDFTGVNFTGVNIMELDLSESNITPEQIAQALGRVPGRDELKKIMAPKKKKGKGFQGLDMSELFLGNGKEFGVIDVLNDKGISIETLMKVGGKVFRKGAEKPKGNGEEVLKNIRSEQELKVKSHSDELRKVIEERKRKALEEGMAMKTEIQKEVAKDKEPVKEEKVAVKENKNLELSEHIRSIRNQGRE